MFSVFFSPLCSVQAHWHHAQAAAVWGSQHHHRLCVRGPWLAVPAAGGWPEAQWIGPELRVHHRGQRGLRQNCHHLPPGGPQLPWRPHATDRIQQPERISEKWVLYVVSQHTCLSIGTNACVKCSWKHSYFNCCIEDLLNKNSFMNNFPFFSFTTYKLWETHNWVEFVLSKIY